MRRPRQRCAETSATARWMSHRFQTAVARVPPHVRFAVLRARRSASRPRAHTGTLDERKQGHSRLRPCRCGLSGARTGPHDSCTACPSPDHPAPRLSLDRLKSPFRCVSRWASSVPLSFPCGSPCDTPTCCGDGDRECQTCDERRSNYLDGQSEML